MTVPVNPPPLQIPPEFAQEKIKNKFFSGLINTLYQLWTSVYGLRINFKGLTTDATPTAVLRVPVANGKTTMVVAYLVARRTGGIAGAVGDSAWYRLIGAYKNINGTLTGIGTPSLFGGEDQAGWDFYFTSSAEEIILTVVGAASNDITWEGSVSTYVVGA
jgi:hypothetical protein